MRVWSELTGRLFRNLRGAMGRSPRCVSVMLAALLAGACGGDGGDGGGGGGTVVVGMRSDFGSFNPVTSSGGYDLELMNYALFTPIVQYDENLEVQPYLAESWELHGDTGVTFRIRQDVRWHDGQPVTARDVEFTFNLAKNEEAASLLGTAFIAEVASAEVVDDYTITFRFVQPHAQAQGGGKVGAEAVTGGHPCTHQRTGSTLVDQHQFAALHPQLSMPAQRPEQMVVTAIQSRGLHHAIGAVSARIGTEARPLHDSVVVTVPGQDQRVGPDRPGWLRLCRRGHAQQQDREQQGAAASRCNRGLPRRQQAISDGLLAGQGRRS